MIKYKDDFVYFELDDTRDWARLPKDTELFLVDDNPEKGLKAGWSKFTWYGETAAEKSLESYRAEEGERESFDDVIKFRTPLVAFREFVIYLLDGGLLDQGSYL